MRKQKKYRFARRKGRAIQVTFANMPGKWFSTGTDDMSQAVIWAEKAMEHQGELPTDSSNITLGEFAKDFFRPTDPKGFRNRNEMRGYGYAESYYEQKQSLLENYILPTHGRFLLSSINDVLIEDLIYNSNSIASKGKRGLSNDTKNKIFATYNIVLDEARRRGYLASNPCDKALKMARRPKTREAFTSEELKKLFPMDKSELVRIWGDAMWACYFLIQYETGWRPGEVAALEAKNFFPESNGIYTTSDIDWKNRSVQPRIKTTDSGQRFKAGILSKRTAELLSWYIHQSRKKYPFIQSNGKFIGSNGANKHLCESCTKAGVDIQRNGVKRTQYSFRHSFQSYYLGRIPENARLLLMGHTKMRNEYTHLDAHEVIARVHEVEGLDEAIEKRRS